MTPPNGTWTRMLPSSAWLPMARRSDRSGIGSPGLETGSGPPDGNGRDHPWRRREVWRASRQYGNRSRARGTGALTAAPQSSGRMANMPPQAGNRNRAANPRIHGRKSNNRSPRTPDWMPAYEALRHDWNSLIEDARRDRYPIHSTPRATWTSSRAFKRLRRIPDIPAKSRAPLIQLLENHQHYLSTRKQILEYPGEAKRHMDARASLQTRCGGSGHRADRGFGLPGLAAGGRAPHGGGRGHPLR